MIVPAYCRPSAFEALACELPLLSTRRGLVRAACAVASHEHAELKARSTLESLDLVVTTVRRRAPSASPNAQLAHLHDMLFDVLGFRGNSEDYYDPANSYLPDVVSSRKGLPITLSLVYKYVAEELGLRTHGVNAPGHFLVAVEMLEGANRSLMFVDPFYGGTLLSLPEVYMRIEEATGRPVYADPGLLAPASHHAWITRMLGNLQAIFARSGREKDLYAMQEMQMLVESRSEGDGG